MKKDNFYNQRRIDRIVCQSHSIMASQTPHPSFCTSHHPPPLCHIVSQTPLSISISFLFLHLARFLDILTKKGSSLNLPFSDFLLPLSFLYFSPLFTFILSFKNNTSPTCYQIQHLPPSHPRPPTLPIPLHPPPHRRLHHQLHHASPYPPRPPARCQKVLHFQSWINVVSLGEGKLIMFLMSLGEEN